MPPERLAYDIVDVFTDRPFAGNQLAVVHEGEGLSPTQCRAIARELHLSETTFPEPGPGSSYRVRIFTPGGEIPFAGHPTLGTAWVLREKGLLTGTEVVQHCGAGPIEVRFDGADIVALKARPGDLLGPLPGDLRDSLLADVGLGPDTAAGAAWLAGTGLTFVHVPVDDSAVGRALPARGSLRSYSEAFAALGAVRDPVEGINLYAVDGIAPSLDVRSRVFVPGLSIPEDPATGSAATGLGLALVVRGVLPDGGRYTVSQGVEIGRPSVLYGGVTVHDGVVTACEVSGGVWPTGRGEIAVPPSP